MGQTMKAVQRPDAWSDDGCIPCELKPGEWCWVNVDFSSKGGPKHLKTIMYHTPNPNESYGILDQRWTITGDGETITVSPSIWIMPNRGKEAGEWHGFLTNGEWREC